MHVALFWGSVAPEWQNDDYASIGLLMFEKVQEVPGFVALRRLDVAPGEELAIAYFETEEAMKAWYDQADHRAVEVLGRREVLSDYTIEVLEMTRSYTMETSSFEPTPEDDAAADRLLARIRGSAPA